MNSWAFFSLFSGLMGLFLGAYVYYQNKRQSLNVVFALYCLWTFGMAFCEFMYRQAESINKADWWLKTSSFWPLQLAFLLHFALIFTGHKNFLKFRPGYGLIYLPMALAGVAAFIFNEPVKAYWGYTYQRTTPMAIIGALAGVYGVFALVLFLGYYLTQSDPLRKKQTGVILVGQLFPAFSGSLVERLFPPLSFPESIITSTAIFAGFTVYAILKYQLFIIDPTTTAENIIQTMPNSLILMDADFKIQAVNQSLLKLLGYEKNTLLGKPVQMLFAEAEPGPERGWREFGRQASNCNFETQFQTSLGVLIPVSFAASAIKNKQGALVGWVGIGTDIREIQQLQARLFQSEKMAAIGQLAGGVAHEINNPIGVILGFAQSIVKRLPEHDPLNLPLKSIEREAVRCKKLIGDLLTFSRSGKTQPEPLNINETIDETLSLIGAETKTADIEILRNYEPTIPKIMVNKNQIQQVIVNICNNAIDAMPGGGRLTFTTSFVDQQIEIRISDTGTGIPQEVKKHIFEPFFTTKDIGKGTGLGLSLCYEIIQKHQGSIEVESEVGAGTTLVIKLPVNDGPNESDQNRGSGRG